MKQSARPAPFVVALRLLALAALLAAPLAHADEYSEIGKLLRSGKPGEALQRADKGLASNPRDPQLQFLRGVAQTDLGRPAEAEASYQQLTQDYPELPEPYNNLAVLYAQKSEFDQARVALQNAIRNNPGYAVAYENLGDIYARLAAQAYEKAQQLDSTTSIRVQPKLTLIRQLGAPASTTDKAAGSR